MCAKIVIESIEKTEIDRIYRKSQKDKFYVFIDGYGKPGTVSRGYNFTCFDFLIRVPRVRVAPGASFFKEVCADLQILKKGMKKKT